MKKKILSLYLRIVLSQSYQSTRQLFGELRRLVTLKPRTVYVFLQLDDPYSYLLSHYLQFVAKQYKVELRIFLCQALRGDFAPQPAMQAEYAVRDCALLAREFGIPFLDKGDAPVVEHRRALLDFLAEEQEQEDFAESFHQALSAYWRGDIEAASRLIELLKPEKSDTNVLVSKNQLLLRKLGHYNSAMMFYAGEWYWGVDRLQYLCGRLDRFRARRKGKSVPELASLAQASHFSLPAAIPASADRLPPLRMYHSFRSPYSFLALQRAYDIADAYGVRLEVKPLLPMVMRGMTVPRQKLLYIVKDASREARRLGISFGNFRDPLGGGVERCMAVFRYARAQGKERDFALAAGMAIWSRGIDVGGDEGMRAVTERAGLFWPDVVKAMQDDAWREQAQNDRETLTESGLWGVPSFVIGELALWGQDRDWLLARQLEDMCHGGDGIVV